MSVNTLIKLVDVPDYRFQPSGLPIDYGSVATDADSKTISLLDAMHFLSINILSMAEEDSIDRDRLSNISAVLYDLSELAIATNKIAQSAKYLSGVRDGGKDVK